MGERGHNRRSIRLPDYDYRQAGAYFVTICVDGRKCALGEVISGEKRLSTSGRIADEGWEWLAGEFERVEKPIYCVMPNHVHAIIVVQDQDETEGITGRGGLQTASTQSDFSNRKPLGRLVGAYKTHTTSQINQLADTAGQRFWQRNYYERVIRNDREHEAIHDYIQANPLNWEEDKEYRRG